MCGGSREVTFSEQFAQRHVPLPSHQNPGALHQLDSMARQAGMSASAFTARFKRQVGMTPGAYVKHWRMQMAARALQHSERSMAQIAEQVGCSERTVERALRLARTYLEGRLIEDGN